MCGEFDDVADLALDSTNTKRRPIGSVRAVMECSDLYDAWMCGHGEERDYSFFSNFQLSYFRIDMFLVDRRVLQLVHSTRTDLSTWSDHAPVSLQLTLDPKLYPFAPWWLNCRLIHDPKLSGEVRRAIEEFFHLNSDSVQDKITFWKATRHVSMAC